MKTKVNIIFLIIVLLFFISCKKEANNKEQSCLPGFIWIQYAGIRNHIKRFTLIRTLENDFSYVSYYKREWDGFADDSTFFNIYCNSFITDSKQFLTLKKYIISNNTCKKEILFSLRDYNSVKIAIVDRCDSVEYIVNNEDKGYFSNMIDSLKIKNESLIEYLEYYERILSANDVAKSK